MRIKLTLEYDGSGFHGWQAQPIHRNQRTVEATLKAALESATGERPRIVAAGRTDAGAHSLGQTVSFDLARDIDPDHLVTALNGVLPDDVAALQAERVGSGFHARFSARRRHYRYLVENREAGEAMLRDRAWHVRQPLDVIAMRQAARALVGRHDLGAFGRDPAGRNTVRDLQQIRIRQQRGIESGILAFEISADAFLYGMVRRVVGFLVEVGSGRRSPVEAADLIRAPRLSGARMAPAHGLYQLGVEYG